MPILNKDFKTIVSFMCSQRFNFILHCYDHTFQIPEFVYFIVFPDFVKIGRTFDLNQRYSPSELKDSVKRIVFVSDIEATEKELKTKFSERYEKFSEKSSERFKINVRHRKKALSLFDSIVEKHNIQKIENKHVRYFHMHQIFGSEYYVSSLVCSILISVFCERDFYECSENMKLIEKISGRIDRNDFIAVVKENGRILQYWKYFGYIIIIDMSSNQVNISRFWKSILKTDNVKDKLSVFLNSAKIKRILQRKISIPVLGGSIETESDESKELKNDVLEKLISGNGQYGFHL